MDLSKNSIAALGQYGFSRRVLLRGMGALTALGAVSPLIAACGSDDEDEPGPASGTTENTPLPEAEPTSPAKEPTTGDAGAEGEPVSGGTLTLGEYDEPPIMDPRVTGATIAWRLLYNIFDPLLVQDTETGDFLPGLADTWEISEDGLVYTLGLKEGVTFHDGTDFNAGAVKFTFDSILEPELKSLAAIGYLGSYAGPRSSTT